MSFWKLLPPGWLVSEFDYENEFGSGDEGDGDGGGGDGGDGGDGGGGDGGDGGDDSDGDSGFDYSWEREQQREEDDRREEEDRRREEQRRREEEDRRRREEEERQRQIEEQRRRIEEENRRMQEEQDRQNRENAAQQQDLDGDGAPDAGASAIDQQSQDIQQSLDEQFQQYEAQRKEQEANFDPSSPDWIYRDASGNDFRGSWAQEDASMGGPAYELPEPLLRPQPEVRDFKPPEALAPQPTADVPRVAAEAAATAAVREGAPAEQVAQVAEAAARIASDRQTLAQQSGWTRAMFRGEYGANAESEWVRQHEAELRRNQQLYGSREPRAGAAPVVGSPAGTPNAPNRRIGAVLPPRAGEDARYGINTPALPGATTPDAARIPPPGVQTPQASSAPPAPASTSALAAPLGGGLSPADQAEMDQAAQRPIFAPSSLVPRPPQPPPMNPGGLSPVDQAEMDQAGRRIQPPMPGGLSPADQAEMDQATAPRPVTGGLSPADQAEMDQAATQYRPPPVSPYIPPGQAETPGPYQTQPAAYDERGNPIEYIQGRPTPVRNTVEYDPVTGRTTERNYGTENLASTDTSVQPAPVRPPPVLGEDLAPIDATVDPVRAAIDSDRPLDTLAQLAAQAKGPGYDGSQDAIHIAGGIAAMLKGDQSGVWAEPYLNDVARLAWARQEREQGRLADPRNTPVEYVEKWKDAFYGSDHNVPLVKEMDQQIIDYVGSRTPAGKTFNWKDAFGDPLTTGDKGLITAQVTSVDCGPTALSAVFRSRGYNADNNTVFAYAKQEGFHNGVEFQGPSAMVRFAQTAGFEAEQTALDANGWNKVDAELDAGRPVMLSGPGHWWVVTAKNDKGQYYAGPTALKGNSPWQPRGGFVFNGVANTAVFVRGEGDPNSKPMTQMNLRAPAAGAQNTRPLLSGQTQYETPARRGTARLSQEMTQVAPTPQTNLKPTFTVADTREMQQRILNEAPQIQFDPADDLDTRIRKMAPTAEWLEREYGYPAELTVGLAIAENNLGAGVDSPAVRGNNIFSLQANPNDTLASGLAPGQSRWAAYPTINHALARKIGIFAHPENTNYQSLWQNRQDPDRALDNLVKGGYIVEERDFPIATWRRNVNAGRERYRRVTGKQ